MTSHTDVLVIGAGPSGCVASAYLNKKGIKVKVVEKNHFPRFVIGESLLPRCMEHFEEAGLLDVLMQQGYEIKRGARFTRNEQVCEFHFDDKHGEGWDWTWQVPRADFDNVLAQEVLRQGVDLQFGAAVTGVAFDKMGNSSTTVHHEDGTTETIHAKFIIDSSGWGRVLPRILDLDKPSKLPRHSSIFTHVKDELRPAGFEGCRISFDILDKDTWLWIIPFSNGITSVGVVGGTTFFNGLVGTNTQVLRELLARFDRSRDRFATTDFLFEPVILKNVAQSVKQTHGKGFALTGNSAEFLDPVFSSGVTFATESGLLAAKLIAKELNGGAIDWQKDYSDYISRGVDVFATYVKEWYSGNLQKLFFAPNVNADIKRQICAVLAGYVWDETNPFVTKHDRVVKALAHVISL
ncbi:MAG: pyridine nucleotide-disulfide oxidoreductase [Cytophagaceae bacterium]|nr:pyridine nucleotide-disulfide oxidoreductase [Cytophagaceae bacterium]